MSVAGNGGGRSEFVEKPLDMVLELSTFGVPPLPSSAIPSPMSSGFQDIQHQPPQHPYISNQYSRTQPTSVPHISYHSIPTHFATTHSSGHTAGFSGVSLIHHDHSGTQNAAPHLMQYPNRNHFMNRFHIKDVPLVSQPLEGLPAFDSVFVKQEPGHIPREHGLAPGEIPFIKREPEAMPLGSPFDQPLETISRQPCYIKREPGTGMYNSNDVPFIKQEPGTVPFSGHDAHRALTFIKQEPGCGNSIRPPIKLEPGIQNDCLAEVPCSSSTSEGDFAVSFPSQPLNLNFMEDIEDIVRPSLSGNVCCHSTAKLLCPSSHSEVSIESIKNELASFDGPSDQKSTHRRVNVVKEVVDEHWEPPLWKQQYENVRDMRSKRDAPVDKYGCFMNAERDVPPEVVWSEVYTTVLHCSL